MYARSGMSMKTPEGSYFHGGGGSPSARTMQCNLLRLEVKGCTSQLTWFCVPRNTIGGANAEPRSLPRM